MTKNVKEQFAEEIKKNLTLFNKKLNNENEFKNKLNEIYETIPFNGISNDKLLLFLYKQNVIYKLFYKYNELKGIKEELKENLNEANEEKYKKIKSFFSIIKSERNGNFIINDIKFEKVYNVCETFLIFQYQIYPNVEKISSLRNYMKNNISEITESYIILILKQIIDLLQQCHTKEIVLLNLSIDTLFFVNENYFKIYFNDFTKSKYLDKKSYEYKDNYYLKREFFKVDIFDLGKIMYILFSKNENVEYKELFNKVYELKGINSNMEKLLRKMLEPDLILRFNIFQITDFFNNYFKDIQNENIKIIKINEITDKKITLSYINKKRNRVKYKIKE